MCSMRYHNIALFMLNWSIPALVFIGILSGCATRTTPTLAPERYHRIGVISLMGHEVQAKYVGVWAFSNKSWRGEVGDWQMAAITQTRIVESLRRRGFDPVALQYDYKQWAERNERRPSGFTLSGLVAAYGGDVATKEFRAELAQFVSTDRLDAIMIFVPGRDTTTQTGESWIGVGDTGMGFRSVGSGGLSAYVLGSIYLVEGLTGKTVRRERLQSWGPTLPIPYPESWAALSTQQQEALRVSIITSFENELEPVLGRL